LAGADRDAKYAGAEGLRHTLALRSATADLNGAFGCGLMGFLPKEPPMKKYLVTLTAEERQSLHELTTAGKASSSHQRVWRSTWQALLDQKKADGFVSGAPAVLLPGLSERFPALVGGPADSGEEQHSTRARGLFTSPIPALNLSVFPPGTCHF
jgi:hypothetical protein